MLSLCRLRMGNSTTAVRRVKRGGAKFAQHVKGAPGELARDRQRGARVAEPAGFEREVVWTSPGSVDTGLLGGLGR
jgi:hypothetical protein